MEPNPRYEPVPVNSPADGKASASSFWMWVSAGGNSDCSQRRFHKELCVCSSLASPHLTAAWLACCSGECGYMRMPLTGSSSAQLLLMACQAFERTLATVVFAWGTRLFPTESCGAAGAHVDQNALHTLKPFEVPRGGNGALLIKILLIWVRYEWGLCVTPFPHCVCLFCRCFAGCVWVFAGAPAWVGWRSGVAGFDGGGGGLGERSGTRGKALKWAEDAVIIAQITAPSLDTRKWRTLPWLMNDCLIIR